jgi:hypothetical protein
VPRPRSYAPPGAAPTSSASRPGVPRTQHPGLSSNLQWRERGTSCPRAYAGGARRGLSGEHDRSGHAGAA